MQLYTNRKVITFAGDWPMQGVPIGVIVLPDYTLVLSISAKMDDSATYTILFLSVLQSITVTSHNFIASSLYTGLKNCANY